MRSDDDPSTQDALVHSNPTASLASLAGRSDQSLAVPDLLAFTPDAKAFAQIIREGASTPGNMTIGVFGRWGSGKTYFLDRLRAELGDSDAVAANGARIRQVSFNAWQYVQADLQTSLVNVILTELAEPGLLKGLESVQGTKEELVPAVEALNINMNELADLQQSLADRLAKLQGEREVVATTAWASDATRAALKEPSSSFEARTSDFLRTTSDRGPTLGSVLTHFSVLPLMIGAAAVLFGIVGILILNVLANQAKIAMVWHLATLMIAGVGLTLLVMTLIGASRTRHYLDRRLGDLKADIQGHREHTLARIDEEESGLRAQSQETEVKLQGKRDEVERLNKQLDEAPSIDSITDYLKRRAEDREHGGRLGMLALVRRDFETLSRILLNGPNSRNSERVVLYVDDLDRCPPDRVVATLEAIHILLSMPLFTVVVAVDIRWLSAALIRQYSSMIVPSVSSDPQVGVAAAPTSGATALDYLEKIFQVPYWVPELDAAGARRLLKSWMCRVAPPDNMCDEASETNPAFSSEDRTYSISPREVGNLLASVAAIVTRTPRTLQRFITVVGVIFCAPARWRYSPDAGQFVASAWSQSDRQIAILLLALVHGVPELAPALCQHLISAREGSTVQAVLTSFESVQGISSSAVWQRVRSTVLNYVSEHSAECEWQVEDLAYWAGRARQFSYFAA